MSKFFVFIVIQRAAGGRPRRRTGLALLKITAAEVAFGHLLAYRSKLRRAVGTGRRAGAAADALFTVDHDEAVFLALEVRLRGTDLHAGGIGAVVARDRDVVGLHVLVPGARGAILTPTARLHFNHFAEVAPHLKIVGVLARDDAGLASLRNEC